MVEPRRAEPLLRKFELHAEFGINTPHRWGLSVTKAFTCYIHKPGVMTPELRMILSESEQTDDLVESVERQVWPDFDLIEVYDLQNNVLLRATSGSMAPGSDRTDTELAPQYRAQILN